ncbi:MAG: hypothetical protein LBP59_17475 [Planctomycetaceae bacterium]|jgi:hypothetical protein|nr:hypothetical protein [Planctomycetaceae bacterium]
MRYLVIDGMLNGTGIRDIGENKYIRPDELKLDKILVERIRNWLEKYALAYYENFINKDRIEALDTEGIEITIAIKKALPTCKIDYYYSAAKSERIYTFNI